MTYDVNYLGMVIFLTLGTLTNLPFFIRCLVDVFRREHFRKMPAALSALFTTSFAELCWVLPCFVQCALQLFSGDGPWTASNTKVGCDTMGFYSVFGSMAGMTSTLWASILTWRAVTGRAPFSARMGVAAGVIIVVLSAFVSSFPFMGVGSFAYTVRMSLCRVYP